MDGGIQIRSRMEYSIPTYIIMLTHSKVTEILLNWPVLR